MTPIDNILTVFKKVHHKMLTDGILVKQANGDADSLIVLTALALAGSRNLLLLSVQILTFW